jgi:hypothetical protein
MTLLSNSMMKIGSKCLAFGILFLIAIQLAGCAAIGPPTVDRDRFDYVNVISEAWKRQTLLNILKTRYTQPFPEPPLKDRSL